MKLIFFISIFVFIGCTTPEEAGISTNNAAYSSDLSPSKWRSSSVFPLNLKVSSDFDNDEFQAISTAADAWSDSVDNDKTFFNTNQANISPKSSLSRFEDSVLGIYKMYSWPSSLPNTALAVTQINGTQKSGYIRINHADILLNYDYFTFTTDASWGYDLETVLVHELGHFLGLYHTNISSNDSVMYPTISRYNINRAPKETDANTVRNKYKIRNSLSASSSNSALAGELEDNSPGVPVTIQLELYPNDIEIIRINGKRIN